MFELCPGNRLHVIWSVILHPVWANRFWFFRIQLTFWNKYLEPGPKNDTDFHSGWKVWYKKGKESINYRGFLFWDIQKLNLKVKLKKKNPEGFYNLAAWIAFIGLAILASPERVRNVQVCPTPDLHQNLCFCKIPGSLRLWQFEEPCFRICLSLG